MSWFSKQQAKTSINHYSRKDTNHHIKGSDTAANRRTLVIVPIAVDIDDRLGSGRLDRFTTLIDTEMDLNTAANWDTVTPTDYTVAATRAGKDFCVYACMQAGSTPTLMLSSATTYPSGYTANNSRKIIWFHCLAGTVAGVNVARPTYGFLVGDIAPTSVFDLLFRPVAEPTGMVYLASKNIAVDAYLASGNGSGPTSVFGATIADNLSWDAFSEIGRLQNKRLLTESEFMAACYGGLENISIKAATDPVTVTAAADSNDISMISDAFIWGLAGIEYQWLIEHVFHYELQGDVFHSASSLAGKVVAVTNNAAPGVESKQLYLKYAFGRPYICADVTTNRIITFGSTFVVTFMIVADVDPSTGGCPINFVYNATTSCLRLTANNSITGTHAHIPADPHLYAVAIVHAASPGGVAIYYNTTTSRLESTAATTNMDIASSNPPQISTAWNTKGYAQNQGLNGMSYKKAGGFYLSATYSGSRAIDSSGVNGAASQTNAWTGARFCSSMKVI